MAAIYTSPYIEPYYPLSKIKTGLYTKGGEFISYFENEKDYIGLYHELPNGEYWTEDIPIPNKSYRLIKKRFELSKDVILYNSIREREQSNYVQPIAYYPIVTDADYERGVISRFFVQKRSSPNNTIIEIDAPQQNSINRSNQIGISYLVWNNCAVNWHINGQYAEQINRNSVDRAEINFPGIKNYLRNLLEFWK